ncbi:MAG: hypothetical protein C0625_08380 [Arcobacter sp.]|nr:MAG: hypothetical protein C0625_08380 [Arcobacter sp.]
MRFYKRGNTLYVDYINNGKRIRKSTKLNYNENNIKLYKNLLLNGNDNVSFFLNDLVSEIIEEKRLILKATSVRCYESIYNSLIKPYFNDVLITNIKSKDIHKWQMHLVSKKILSNSITFARTILNQTFDRAILEEIIEVNPLKAVKISKNLSSYEVKPFTLKEIERILFHAPKHFKNMLGVAFFTGLRTGELIGLKWDDINFKNRTISIKRTINRGSIQSPKTKSSIRVVDIIEPCYTYLYNQQLYTKLKSEFVFLGNKGTYSGSHNLRTAFMNILKSAGIEYRSIYHTRHTFASMMLNEGENLIWVSQMLGHKDSSVTLKKYSKYIKKEEIKRASFLDDWHTVGTHKVV